MSVKSRKTMDEMEIEISHTSHKKRNCQILLTARLDFTQKP